MSTTTTHPHTALAEGLMAIGEERMGQAAQELARELQVRERCFRTWVKDGRLSKYDAKDRLERQTLALKIIELAIDTLFPSVDSSSAEATEGV